MGIKGLMKLIADNAPRAIKERDIKFFNGQKIAVDASMCLYQFLIAVRTGGDDNSLTNENGEVTSHLQGMFYRTIRMLEAGIKPAFVFDGKPPEMKQGEIQTRMNRRADTEVQLKEAQETGDQEDINKYTRRLVHVTKEHNAEVKLLLRLMGVPVIEAPGEAEAQCAWLVKADKVFATATEDMDALTFGSKKLLRHLTFSAARKMPVVEIDVQVVLEDLAMNMDEFIDLCVLCGCDYTTTIKGIGPGRSIELIRKHRSTEEALKTLDPKKHQIPEDFLYKEAAALFKEPLVDDPEKLELEWKSADEEGVLKFLVDEKGFNKERIEAGLKRLKAAKGKGTQQRMESFFGMSTTTRPNKPDPKTLKGKNAKKGASTKKGGPPPKKFKK